MTHLTSYQAPNWTIKHLFLYRSIKEVQACKELQLTETQKLGLAHYEHLSAPVTREETERIVGFVQSQLALCAPEASVEAVGGYRRWVGPVQRP